MVLADPQELLKVPGLQLLLEGVAPYTQRHFARADRLLRSTYVVDYVLGAMSVLSPEEGQEGVSALQQGVHAQTGSCTEWRWAGHALPLPGCCCLVGPDAQCHAYCA